MSASRSARGRPRAGTAARVATAASLLLPALAWAAPASPRDEEAFGLVRERETVTVASKRPQPVSETPSLVTVVTAEEIRAHGYRTLAEALEWVRGFYTRYDRNYTYLGVRGLQRPGDYNNRVLLTIDGHTLNTPIYGDAAVGRELGLDLERVERIEVVRGPGSALYGTNAVLAVVNVVTRDARSSPALEAAFGVGGPGERRGFASLASARPGRPEFAVSGSWADARGAEFLEPAPGAARIPAPGTDRDLGTSLLGHAAWRESRLAFKFNRRVKHVPTGAYGTRLGDPGTRTRDTHDFVELSTRTMPLASLELASRAYWDGARYAGDYAYGPDSARRIFRDTGESDVVGAELRAHWRPADRHVATVSVEGRWILRAEQEGYETAPYLLESRSQHRSATGSVGLQDELTLGGGARLAAGARLDAQSCRPAVASPRLDVLLPLGPLTAWKLMAGSAFRAPVPYETHYAFDTQLPNPDLLPEHVNTLESSLEHRFGEALASVSVYRSWIRDLIESVVIDSLGTSTYFNRGRAASTGVESEVRWSARPGLHVRAVLAFQRSREANGPVNLTGSPYWNGHLVLTRALPGRPLRLGASARFLGARTTLASDRLPAYAIVNARAALAPRGPFEIGLEVRNLLDTAYSDPGASEHAQDAIAQDGRSLRLTLDLRRPAGP